MFLVLMSRCRPPSCEGRRGSGHLEHDAQHVDPGSRPVVPHSVERTPSGYMPSGEPPNMDDVRVVDLGQCRPRAQALGASLLFDPASLLATVLPYHLALYTHP